MKTDVRYLHEWAKGRPILLATIAQQIAASVEIIGKAIVLVRTNQAHRRVGIVEDHVEWLKLYREPLRMERAMLEAWTALGQDLDVASQLFRLARNTRGRSPKNAHELLSSIPPVAVPSVRQQVEHALRVMYCQSLKAVADMLKDAELTENEDQEVGDRMRMTEMKFFFLVWMPAYLEYGIPATKLFARCRRGDHEALDKLLRLDKAVVLDPKVATHMRHWAELGKHAHTEIITDALAGRPDHLTDRKNVLITMGAAVRRFSQMLDCPLQYEEIRDLFDAAAKDRTGDPHMIEVDLPESPDALRQAIYRVRDFWDVFNNRDTFFPYGCHEELGFMAVVSDFDESEPVPSWIAGTTSGGAAVCRRPAGVVLRFWRWCIEMVNRLLRR